jgi:hypothetical protein
MSLIDFTLVKYYGRDLVIPSTDPLVMGSLYTLKGCIEDIIKLKSTDPNWTKLKDSLLRMVAYLTNANINKKLYRLEILNEAILPYIKSMRGSYTMDPARFDQIEYMLDILSDTDRACTSNGMETNASHPASTFLLCDKLVIEINSKAYWMKSSLAKNLETAVNKQWRPIVADCRNALQNAGVKLFAIGLVEVIGRPILMLYPIWLLLQQVLVIVKQMEHKQQISPRTLIAIVKAVIMLWLSSYLIQVLAMYQGMGYTSLALGSLALGISSSDSTIKEIAPAIAPHLSGLDKFLDRLSYLETFAVSIVGKRGEGLSSLLVPHPQVESLPRVESVSTIDASSDVELDDDLIYEEQHECDLVNDTTFAFGKPGIRKRQVSSNTSVMPDVNDHNPTWKATKGDKNFE